MYFPLLLRVKTLHPFLLIISFLFIKNAGAQTKEHIFKNYSANEGLSHKWVRAITQDKDGYLWFGTADGLNRFDGNSFEVFKNDVNDSLTIGNNFIEALYTDADGKIWVGYTGGIAAYDSKMGCFINYPYNPKIKNTLVSPFVREITGDNNGNIWIGTHDSGISIFNKKNGVFTNLRNDPKDSGSLASNKVSTLVTDKNGDTWIGTENAGVDLYNAKTKKIIHYYGTGSNSALSKVQFIRKMNIDSKGNIWILTSTPGALLYDPANDKMINIDNVPKDNYYLGVLEHPNGEIWLSAENKGIFVYNPEKKSVFSITHNSLAKYSLGHNSVYKMYIDNNKNLWLGTFAGGVSYYLSQNNNFGYYFNIPDNPKSLSNNSILCFAHDKKNLFIGTDGGGLNILNLSTGEIKKVVSTIPGIKMDIILAMCNEDDKYLWMVIYKEGILRYNILNGEIENFTQKINLPILFKNSCSSIVIDKKKNLWLGAWGNGLYHFDFKKNKLTLFNATSDKSSLSSGIIFHLMEDADGKIWISTIKGLNQLEDFEKNKFIKYNVENNDNRISNDIIQMSFADSKGCIWVCTSNGLDCIDKVNKKITSFSTKDGLPNNFINGLTEDKNGNIWVSTNGGLSRLDRQNRTFKNFFNIDGLQGNIFNPRAVCNIIDRNLVVFGGGDGFNVFNPNEIHTKNNIPEVRLTNLWVQDEKITPFTNKDILTNDISNTDEIELDYDVDKFKIDFVGVNLINAYKNKYAYYLEGFDKTWYYTDKLSVTYTNLDPGKYLLHLKVSNDGSWNKKIKTLIIHIRDPYWKTWWFILIEVVLFGSLWFLSLYSRSSTSNNYINGVLTIFTLIATLELITTTVDNIVDLHVNPVYTFLLNFTMALILMPLELLLKKWIDKTKENKLRKELAPVENKS